MGEARGARRRDVRFVGTTCSTVVRVALRRGEARPYGRVVRRAVGCCRTQDAVQ